MKNLVVVPWGSVAALIACVAGCGGGSGSPDAAGMAGMSGGTSGGAGGAGGHAGSGGGGTGMPQSVITGEDLPSAIALDDAFVYWTTATAIRRIARSGGDPTTLFSAQGTPDSLMVQGATLYWRNGSTPNGVFSGPKTGGQASMLVGGLPQSVALDADFVYWADANDWILRRTSKAGGAAREILAGPDTFGALSADDQYLYWAEGMARVRRVAKAGGTIMDLKPADSSPAGLMVGWSVMDDAFVYFSTSTPIAQTSALHRVAKTGGAGQVLASALDTADAIAVAGDSVYWLTRGDTDAGYLMRVPRAGGSPAMLATGIGLAGGIAVDAQHAYWTEAGNLGARNGLIRRVPR